MTPDLMRFQEHTYFISLGSRTPQDQGLCRALDPPASDSALAALGEGGWVLGASFATGLLCSCVTCAMTGAQIIKTRRNICTYNAQITFLILNF